MKNNVMCQSGTFAPFFSFPGLPRQSSTALLKSNLFRISRHIPTAENASSAFRLETSCRKHFLTAQRLQLSMCRGIYCMTQWNLWQFRFGAFSRFAFTRRARRRLEAEMEINKIPAPFIDNPRKSSADFRPFVVGKAFKIYIFFLSVEGSHRRRQRMRPEIEAKLLKIGCHCVGSFSIDQQAEAYFRALEMKGDGKRFCGEFK